MSSDRICQMSDLRAAENRLGSKISAAESKARKAESNVSAIRSDMKKVKRKVSNLASNVSQLSGDVSKQRQQIYQLDGEIVELEAQQDADRRLIQNNQQLINSIEQDIAVLDQDVAANRQMIGQVRQHAQILQQEMDLAQQRIEENNRYIQQLDDGIRQINDYLAEEERKRQEERAAKERDLDAQEQLAADLKTQVDPARARFFGAYNEYLSATSILDQAQVNRQKGNLETAIAQYQQGQNGLIKVGRDIDERERAFENKRAQCQATLKQLEAELNLLDSQDMQNWYPAEFSQLQKRVQALRQSFDSKQYEAAGEPVEIRTALEQLTTQAMQIYQDVRLLETKLLETIAQHKERLARVRDIMQVLRRVWDQDFEYDLSFMNKEDPKSTLKLQTERPGAPNVTVYLDLDRTVQFSWTGYEGMQCMEDIEQFEQVMHEENQVEIELVGEPANRPSNPNPPFGDGGSQPTFVMPKTATQQREQVRRK